MSSKKPIDNENSEITSSDTDTLLPENEKANRIEKAKNRIWWFNLFAEIYRLASRLWNVALHILDLLKHAVGIAGTVVPIIGAIVNVIQGCVDIINTLFYEVEKHLPSKVVKIATSILSVGLGVAATVLILALAQTPIGLSLIVGAMVINTIKEAYLYKKERKALFHAKMELTSAEEDLTYTQIRLADLEENNQQSSKNGDMEKLKELKESKVLKERIIEELKERIANHTKQCDEKALSIGYSVASVITMSLFTLAAFATAGLILFLNPITLIIGGSFLLAFVTGIAIYDKVVTLREERAQHLKTIEKNNKILTPVESTPSPVLKAGVDPVNDHSPAAAAGMNPATVTNRISSKAQPASGQSTSEPEPVVIAEPNAPQHHPSKAQGGSGSEVYIATHLGNAKKILGAPYNSSVKDGGEPDSVSQSLVDANAKTSASQTILSKSGADKDPEVSATNPGESNAHPHQRSSS